MTEENETFMPEVPEEGTEQPSWEDTGKPQPLPDGDWSTPPAEQPSWEDTGKPQPLPEGDWSQ